MLKLLLNRQMSEIFKSYFYNEKKNKNRSLLTTVLLITMFVLLMVFVLGGMFTFLSLNLCSALAGEGLGWFYFAIMGLIAVFLGTLGSVFTTYSSLYLSKDNDLLLSLPIPVKYIILSRLLGVYLIGAMYSSVVSVPCVLVYWFYAGITAANFIGDVLFIILISLFVLILSCILGLVVAKVSLKLKNKSFVIVIISIVFIAVYYFFYFKVQKLLSVLIANAALYASKVKGVAYVLYLFGKVGEGNFTAAVSVVAITFLLLAVMWIALSSSFIKITTSSFKTYDVKSKKRSFKMRSVSKAMFNKELMRFTSSSNYMLNCGLSSLILIVLGIVLIFKGNAVVDVFGFVFGTRSGYSQILLCAGICMASSMNDMTAPSVSLEGENIWIVHSLPISPWQVLKAKISLQLVLTVIPALFCALCIIFVVPISFIEFLLTMCTIILYILLYALFGLFMGLKMPNITWSNEITPIKQSFAVMITILAGWGYALILGGVYILIGYKFGLILYLLLFVCATCILCMILYRWLKNIGCKIFDRL